MAQCITPIFKSLRHRRIPSTAMWLNLRSLQRGYTSLPGEPTDLETHRTRPQTKLLRWREVVFIICCLVIALFSMQVLWKPSICRDRSQASEYRKSNDGPLSSQSAYSDHKPRSGLGHGALAAIPLALGHLQSPRPVQGRKREPGVGGDRARSRLRCRRP